MYTEIIYSIQEDVCGFCTNTTSFYTRLEHPWILDTERQLHIYFIGCLGLASGNSFQKFYLTFSTGISLPTSQKPNVKIGPTSETIYPILHLEAREMTTVGSVGLLSSL
jgi:hypothetical protein